MDELRFAEFIHCGATDAVKAMCLFSTNDLEYSKVKQPWAWGYRIISGTWTFLKIDNMGSRMPSSLCDTTTEYGQGRHTTNSVEVSSVGWETNVSQSYALPCVVTQTTKHSNHSRGNDVKSYTWTVDFQKWIVAPDRPRRNTLYRYLTGATDERPW